MDGIFVNLRTGEKTVALGIQDPQGLALNKISKLKEIEAARDADLFKDVAALGTMWQADERSQKLLSSAITLAQSNISLPPVWRDSFNVDLAITSINQLLAIAGEIALQTQQAYSKSWQLKAQVASATTEEDLAAINW